MRSTACCWLPMAVARSPIGWRVDLTRGRRLLRSAGQPAAAGGDELHLDRGHVKGLVESAPRGVAATARAVTDLGVTRRDGATPRLEVDRAVEVPFQ